jgi:DNA-directed RNA polymerase specialized sigma54-like protein
MLTQEQARERLLPMNLEFVAREIGISGNTLRRFASGKKTNSDTFELISNWLERYGK